MLKDVDSMAIYHLSARTGSRKYASSAKAKAQYILREGRYAGDSAEVLFSESAHMPAWAAGDAVDYWKVADCYERANGRLFNELEIALPKELNLTQQIELAREYVGLLTEGEKLPYTLAIHEGGGGNPHFHVMISPRRNDDGIERPRKQWCRRYNAKNPEKGGARKTTNIDHRDWLIRARESWTVEANHALKCAGRSERISHLSLEEQGIDRIPQVHRGAGSDALERRGFTTERGDIHRQIERENRRLLEEAKRTKALKEAEGVESLRRAREQHEAMIRQKREEADALRAKVALAKKKKKELEERERQEQAVEVEEQWSSWLSGERELAGEPESSAEAELRTAILNKDFRGMGLRDQVLRDLDLRKADFTGTTLIDVKFVNVDLSSARFDRTWMERVQFEGGSMRAAHLQASMLRDVGFKGSKERPLSLSKSEWVGVEFSGDLEHVCLLGDFEECTLDIKKLHQLDLRGSYGLQFEKALSERILKNNAELNRALFERKGLSPIPKEGVEGVVVAHAYFASTTEPCGIEKMSVVEAADGRRFATRGVREVGTRVRFTARQSAPEKELKPPKKDRGFER